MRGVSGATTSGREAKRSDETRTKTGARIGTCSVKSRRFVVPNASEKTLLSSDPRSVRRRSQRSARRHTVMLANLGKRSRSGEAKGPRAPTCPHGRANRGYLCKECPGKGICEHGRVRSKCKECGALSICEHGRERSRCKECGEHLRAREGAKHVQEGARASGASAMQGGAGGSICEHGRAAKSCKECGGSSICEHGRVRSECKECGGASICEHGRVRSKCKECGGGASASTGGSVQGVRGLEHLRAREAAKLCKECGEGSASRRQRTRCKECGGSGICEHGRQRYSCKACARSSRIRARDAKAPLEAKVEIKQEFDDVEDPGEEDYSLQ